MEKQQKMLKLILENLDYNPKFDENSFGQPNSNEYSMYKTVAIIGSQSTGKSTLMNHLFGTTFETLNQ